MKYEKYLIKKEKKDLLSSLKALNEKIINEKFKEYGANNLEELKKYIIEEFESILEMSIDDSFTQMYFQRLLDHEDSEWMSAYQEDIESLFVFVYKNNNYYSYYIPIEIKEIIRKLLYKVPTNEEFNLSNAANTPIVKDLKGLLNALVVKDLRHIGDLFLINRLSNKPKKELVKIIYEALTNEKKLSEVIERFIDKESNLLKKLILEKGTIQDNNINNEEYHFLYMLGIVFLFKRDNKFYISMTDDVYNVISKMDLNKFDKIIEENTKAYNLIRSMVELYGVVSYGDLIDAYSQYYSLEDELDIPNNALYFCDRIDSIEHIYTEHNSYYINRILNNDKLEPIFDDIITRQQEIKRKTIRIEELLKYSDYNYYEENESRNELKKYLLKHGIIKDNIEFCMINIINMFKLGNSFIEATLEMLEDYGLNIEEKDLQSLLDKIMNVYNNTRIWTNNGWTPIEMRKEYK